MLTDRGLQVHKSLLQIEVVDVGWWRRAVRGDLMIPKLYESSEGIPDMQIAVQQQAVHVIGRGALWCETEERVAEVLHALPELAAEIDVASRRNVEGYEFDRRPEIVWPCGALLIGRNVVIAQKVVGCRRFAQYLAEELMGEQEEQ